MHYKNGRKAKVGDMIVAQDYSGNPIAGIVVDTCAEAETCNLTVMPLSEVRHSLTAGECLLVSDALTVPTPIIPPAE